MGPKRISPSYCNAGFYVSAGTVAGGSGPHSWPNRRRRCVAAIRRDPSPQQYRRANLHRASRSISSVVRWTCNNSVVVPDVTRELVGKGRVYGGVPVLSLAVP